MTNTSINIFRELRSVTKYSSVAFKANEADLVTDSRNIYRSRLTFPYNASEELFNCVTRAFPNHIVVQSNGTEKLLDAPHAHLKFFTDYLRDCIGDQSFVGKNISLIGPKFSKKESEKFLSGASLNKYHFCLKNPSLDDRKRLSETISFFESQLHKLEVDLATHKQIVVNSQTTLNNLDLAKMKKAYKIFSETKATIEKVNNDISGMESRRRKIIRIVDSISSRTENDFCCTGGIELCQQPVDIAIANDSIYDVDIAAAISNLEKRGLRELYAVVILPFGLLFEKSYYSEELDVYFSRYGKGFTMMHASDLSDGYVHKETDLVQLMQHLKINVNGHDWTYEIIRAVGEMCLIKMTPANVGEYRTRKLMPPKFDKYSLIYDPFKYFSARSRTSRVLIHEAKYLSAVQFVQRMEKKETLLYDLIRHVQSSLMRVAIGGTEIQRPADMDLDSIDRIVLSALIEGLWRRARVENAFKESEHDYLFPSLSIDRHLNNAIETMFPGVIDFLERTNIAQFVEDRQPLSRMQIIEYVKGNPDHIWDINKLPSEFRTFPEPDENQFIEKVEQFNNDIIEEDLSDDDDDDIFFDTTISEDLSDESVDNVPEIDEDLVREHFQSDHKTNDSLVQAAIEWNTDRVREGFKLLDKTQITAMIKKLRFHGKPVKCVIQPSEALKIIEGLRSDSFLDVVVTEKQGLNTEFRNRLYDAVKDVINYNDPELLKKKNILVLNAVAGGGKTTYIIDEFIPGKDQYIAPFAEVVDQTYSKIIDKYGKSPKPAVCTYERIGSIMRCGRRLILDESSAVSDAYLLFLLLYTDYEEYWFVGDHEQTKMFSVTGRQSSDIGFYNFVGEEGRTSFFYTFRFSPRVALFLNIAYNYPVFSLCNNDTKFYAESITDIDSQLIGKNITVTSSTVNEYADLLNNIGTAKAAQGTSVDHVNIILKKEDLDAAYRFRANGIVAMSRAELSQTIYYDQTSNSPLCEKLKYYNHYTSHLVEDNWN